MDVLELLEKHFVTSGLKVFRNSSGIPERIYVHTGPHVYPVAVIIKVGRMLWVQPTIGVEDVMINFYEPGSLEAVINSVNTAANMFNDNEELFTVWEAGR